MNILNDLDLCSFDYPSKVKIVVCCDLDETYLPYHNDNKFQSGISELEEFIIKHGERLSLLIGWVTGSNLDAVLRKVDGHISKFPHFVSSSLGTKLHWIYENKMVESFLWKERVLKSGYNKNKIYEIVEILQNAGIEIIPESNDYQDEYKQAFYYQINPFIERDFEIITETAEKFNTKVLFNKCNAAAGDPINCYDVEFIPKCCGKGEVLLFLKDYFELNKEDFWAFGDSCNDFSMFENAGHAFLVGNADLQAKKYYDHILPENYCYAIKNTLSQLLK